MSAPIYLDGFASLPLAPETRGAMIEAFEHPGNAASPHLAGEAAARRIAAARASVANLIGASPSEIVFTSGATEADNLAILGTARGARARGEQRNRIIVSAIEHKAVLEPAQALEGEGFEIRIAPVDASGRLDLDAFSTLADERLLLASVMAVNNETGIIQPIKEAAEIAHAAGALFHSDAAQAAGKIALDVEQLDADFISLSGHKLYGPMGIGALYAAAPAPKPSPLNFGGGHQNGIRPGTEPVALIAGFGAAARVALETAAADAAHATSLAQLFCSELEVRQVRFEPVGGNAPRVPGGFALRLPGVDAEHLCLRLADVVQLTTGSACTSGQLRTSHVLEAMGFFKRDAAEVVRIFCHRYLSANDIRSAAAQIAGAIRDSAVATGEVVQ